MSCFHPTMMRSGPRHARRRVQSSNAQLHLFPALASSYRGSALAHAATQL